MGLEMCILRVAIWISKFWFGSPCIEFPTKTVYIWGHVLFFGLCIVAISHLDDVPVPAARRPVPAPRRPVPAARGTFKNPFYGKSNNFADLVAKKLEQEEQENTGFAISKIVFIQCSKSKQYFQNSNSKCGNLGFFCYSDFTSKSLLVFLEVQNLSFFAFLMLSNC